MTKVIITSGKRKRAVAQAKLVEGTGKILFNRVPLAFVNPEMLRLRLLEPLLLASKYADKVNVVLTVHGGGLTGQIDAARLALARALLIYAKNSDVLKKTFLAYDRQLLVADIRRKEPRKPNRHGKARAKVQKSYR